jgi:transcriptional regulator with XRE-family HTH domain
MRLRVVTTVNHAERILRLSAHFHPLRLVRLSRGLSLRALGAASNVNYSRISLIEHGLEPSDDELSRLAAALGVAPDQLAPQWTSREVVLRTRGESLEIAVP